VTDPQARTGPLQLLRLEDELDDAQRAVRDGVRALLADAVRPNIAAWFERGELPIRELAKSFGSLGLFGMRLTGYGCAGLDSLSYGLACMELESADSGIRSFVSVQGSLAMFALWRWGSDEQKERWLPPMVTGEAIGCFGLTEPDYGSNPAGMRTRARSDGGDWVLDGTKAWITNGSAADVAIVWARTDAGIRGFVVPTDTPGFAAHEIEHKLSLRASVTSELVLDGVRLPADAALPEAKGMRGPLACLAEARFGIVFGALGAARDCLETTIDYACSRVQFDRPIAGYQLTQRKLADLTLELDKGYLLALHLAHLKDSGRLRSEMVSAGKLNNAREALNIARECRTILGANGISLEYPVLRHANNLESVITYEGSSEVHTLVLGKALTGLDAFR
jgi:glutaryl-CoA dehydrogenase